MTDTPCEANVSLMPRCILRFSRVISQLYPLRRPSPQLDASVRGVSRVTVTLMTAIKWYAPSSLSL